MAAFADSSSRLGFRHYSTSSTLTFRISVTESALPGEEMACLAKDLMNNGALLDPEPDFITGLHS